MNPVNPERIMIAGEPEGDGFMLWLFCADCKRRFPAFAGEGVLPTLLAVVRVAHDHRCG